MSGFGSLSWEAIRSGFENPESILQSWSGQIQGHSLTSFWLGLIFVPMVVGLASSFTHCAGMCAPIHFFLASKQGKGVYAYHLGRITTYAGLGVCAGWLGQSLFQAASVGFWAKFSASLLALAYGVMALHWFGLIRVGQWLEKTVGPALAKPMASVMPQFRSGTQAGLIPLFSVGLAGGLLPCPTTQAMLLFSLGLSQVWAGGVTMVFMGLGTLPVFMALRPAWVSGPRRNARAFATVLGLIFVALAVQKVHGAWFVSVPTCH